MRTVLAIQARLSSKRLPRKILADVNGKPMLEHLYRRCRAARYIDEVLVACPEKDELAIFEATGIPPIPGPEGDVLSRLLKVAEVTRADKLVRVTGDCPLICPRLIESMTLYATAAPEPVVVNWRIRSFPNGQDLEIYDVGYLRKVSNGLGSAYDREWFASWIVRHGPVKDVLNIVHPVDLSKYRMTVDYPEDLAMVRTVFAAMGGDIWDLQTIIAYLARNPQVRRLNAKYRKETGEATA